MIICLLPISAASIFTQEVYFYIDDVKAQLTVSYSGVVVSKYGLYVGGLASIPTAITTMTAVGGDAEHVSLNH